MNSIHPSLVKTWVFLAQSSDHKLASAKYLAHKKIKSTYGSVTLAKIYIEQQQDKEIEVVVI